MPYHKSNPNPTNMQAPEWDMSKVEDISEFKAHLEDHGIAIVRLDDLALSSLYGSHKAVFTMLFSGAQLSIKHHAPALNEHFGADFHERRLYESRDRLIEAKHVEIVDASYSHSNKDKSKNKAQTTRPIGKFAKALKAWFYRTNIRPAKVIMETASDWAQAVHEALMLPEEREVEAIEALSGHVDSATEYRHDGQITPPGPTIIGWDADFFPVYS